MQSFGDWRVPRASPSVGGDGSIGGGCGGGSSSSVGLARSAEATACPYATAVPVRLHSLPGAAPGLWAEAAAASPAGSCNGGGGHGGGSGGGGGGGGGDPAGEGVGEGGGEGGLELLSAPFLALEIDLGSAEALPPAEGRTRVVEVPLLAESGVARPDGVVYWWDLVLSRGGGGDGGEAKEVCALRFFAGRPMALRLCSAPSFLFWEARSRARERERERGNALAAKIAAAASGVRSLPAALSP